MRERANTRNFFAVWLEPGDVYTMCSAARWQWQHAIFLSETPAAPDKCRISVVFRLLEEYPA
jgi:alkylated DNA repair dioxygenase AlkB